MQTVGCGGMKKEERSTYQFSHPSLLEIRGVPHSVQALQLPRGREKTHGQVLSGTVASSVGTAPGRALPPATLFSTRTGNDVNLKDHRIFLIAVQIENKLRFC
ncbi:hypothetical protein CEXT_64571 [Caerostris extrusa]|uniref:Uncharacterized protein n=1 Tax=Caerostris extrusa TaxID=172846 RepID=A0AAV4R239_CAEEX|nr:hypothetical protein CEXT_64571 [Caerostris extrusa]